LSEVVSWSSNGYLQSAIDGSADCVMAFDLEGRLVLVNKAGLGLVTAEGFARIEGQHWSLFWPQSAHDYLHEGLAIARRGGQYRFDARVPVGDGTSKEWNVLVSPLRDRDGEIAGAITSAHDATPAFLARREADARARVWEQDVVALRAANRIAQLGAWNYDCATRRLNFSPELVEIVGVGPRLEIADAINLWAEEDREPFAKQLEDAATLGRELVFEGRIARPDDSIRWMRVIGEPEIAGGWCVALRGASQDITASRLAMDQLSTSEQTAVRAVAAMSSFLSTMSHELRTPLNGVLGMVQAMALDDMSEAQRDRLRVIRDSSEALLALLNDLLDMSKIQAGKLELEDGVIEVEALADSVEASAVLLRAKGVDFSVQIADGVRGCWAGDPKRVRQILHNLVANAVKFTEHGSVHVAFSEDRGRLVLQVRDTGIGIPAERVTHIFEQFVQADASMTRRFGGAGLGLSICHDVACLMGGDIRVDTVEGEGSTFTVSLPLSRLDVAEREAPPPLPAPGISTEDLCVLVAEDNLMNQLVLKTLLNAIGIEPVIVSNGEEAVAAWRRKPWDIVLLDIQMPVMDGVSAVRAIREQEQVEGRERTPVIALTANAMPHHVIEYVAAGMDAVIAKPIDLAALVQAMNAATPSNDDEGGPPDRSGSAPAPLDRWSSA
jgi:PAS domain S-box-containing protein